MILDATSVSERFKYSLAISPILYTLIFILTENGFYTIIIGCILMNIIILFNKKHNVIINKSDKELSLNLHGYSIIIKGHPITVEKGAFSLLFLLSVVIPSSPIIVGSSLIGDSFLPVIYGIGCSLIVFIVLCIILGYLISIQLTKFHFEEGDIIWNMNEDGEKILESNEIDSITVNKIYVTLTNDESKYIILTLDGRNIKSRFITGRI
jgi:hypothetical protein